MLEILSPYFLPVVGAVGLWAVGHFGTARLGTWWTAAKAEASKVGTAIKVGEHATAEEAAMVAVGALKWLTDKTRQQAAIAKLQAEIVALDAMAAHVLSVLQKPQ